MSVLYTVQSNMFVVRLLLHQFYLPGDWKKSQAFRPWSSWGISTSLISVCRPKQKSTTNPEIFLENENFLAQSRSWWGKKHCLTSYLQKTAITWLSSWRGGNWEIKNIPKIRTMVLDFRKADFGKCSVLLGRIPLKTVLKRSRSRRVCWFSNITTKLKIGPSWETENQANMAGSLHGWTRISKQTQRINGSIQITGRGNYPGAKYRDYPRMMYGRV